MALRRGSEGLVMVFCNTQKACSHVHEVPLPLSLVLARARGPSPSLPLFLSFSLYPSLPLPLSPSHTPALSPSLPLALTHSRTPPLSPSPHGGVPGFRFGRIPGCNVAKIAPHKALKLVA